VKYFLERNYHFPAFIWNLQGKKHNYPIFSHSQTVHTPKRSFSL